MLQKFTSLFPFWAIILSAIALLHPGTFLPYKDAIPFLLGLVMFGMGMTLTIEDFLLVFKRPKAVIIGTVLQYTLMPLAGFLVARAFSLSPELTAGVVLLGCCPGGTASNVICYLAKGGCRTFYCTDISFYIDLLYYDPSAHMGLYRPDHRCGYIRHAHQHPADRYSACCSGDIH